MSQIAGTHQVAHRLIFHIGHIDRCELSLVVAVSDGIYD